MTTQPQQTVGSTTWVELVDTNINADYVIQNISFGKLLLSVSDTTPTSDNMSHELTQHQFVMTGIFTGKIWAKCTGVDSCMVSVTLG